MALTDENSNGIGATMLVAPTGQTNCNGFGNGFGGDWAWILLLLLLGGNGWGGGFGNFAGGYSGMYEFPWLLNGQQGINNNVSDGFRDAQLHDSVTSVRDGVNGLATQLCGCCGDMQMSLANGFAGVNQNVSNGFANTNLGLANGVANIQNALCNGFNGVTASIVGAQNLLAQQMNTNEMANLNRSFAEQTANLQGFNGVQSGVADLKYTVATENCADRAALAEGIQSIIASQTASTQRILDQLCQDKIDAKNDTIAQLRQELMFSRGQASQVEQTAQLLANNNAQTALFQQGLNNEVDALYSRLSNCPVNTVPVYGNQPIFTCQNSGCGCGN